MFGPLSSALPSSNASEVCSQKFKPCRSLLLDNRTLSPGAVAQGGELAAGRASAEPMFETALVSRVRASLLIGQIRVEPGPPGELLIIAPYQNLAQAG